MRRAPVDSPVTDDTESLDPTHRQLSPDARQRDHRLLAESTCVACARTCTYICSRIEEVCSEIPKSEEKSHTIVRLRHLSLPNSFAGPSS